MQKGWVLILLALIAIYTSGCGVSKDQYMRLENEKRRLEQNVDSLSRQIGQLRSEKGDLSYVNESLQNENRRLREERDSLKEQFELEVQEESRPDVEPSLK